MHHLDKQIKSFYQENPEQLILKKILLIELCEDKIKYNREIRLNFEESDEERQQRKDVIFNSPYSEEEQQKLKIFTGLLEKIISFGFMPDDQDIDVFLETGKMAI